MKNKLVNISLLILQFGIYGQTPVFESSLFDNVSVYEEIDRVNLGVFGQANYSLLSPFKDNSNQLYNTFQKESDSIIYTDLYTVLGQARSGIIEVGHHQPLGKQVYLNLGYFRSSVTGLYNRQLASIADFTGDITYSNKKKTYSATLSSRLYTRKNQLNGGINDTSFNTFYNDNVIELAYPINLLAADLDKRFQLVDFTHQYDFISDSLKTLGIKQQFNYAADKYRYVDQDTSFYKNYFDDTLGSNDSLKTEFLTHNLFLTYTKEENIKAYFGLSNSYADHKANRAFMPSMIHSFLGGGSYLKGNFNAEVDASYTFLGFLSGNYFLNATVDYADDKYLFDNTRVSIRFAETTPNLRYYWYESNHYQWNVGLNNETSQDLSIQTNSSKLGLKLEGKLSLRNNTVYLDTAFTPKQTNLTFVQLGVSKSIQFTKWMGLNTSVYYQNISSSATIELPNFYTNNRLFFEGKLFKNALKFKTGVDVLFYTSFKAKGYNPSLDEFYAQDDREVGNYPFIDFFAEFYLKKSVGFFFKIEHANYQLFGTEHLASPTYRQQDRIMRFGLKWRLYN